MSVTTTACTQPGCTGTIQDGYCDVCGMAPAVTAGSAGSAGAASPAGSAGSGASVGSGLGGGTGVGGSGGTCTQTGCSGSIQDGYCDVCGMAPAVGAAGTAGSGAAGAAASPATTATRSSAPVTTPTLGSALSGRTGSGRTTGGSTRMSGRGRLGAGLVDVPRVVARDPASAVMADPQVAESKRYCSRCSDPVGRGRDGRPGRTEGFCRNCGAQFSFTPKLTRGDLLGGQYEVLGALAHGGLGWIYLARDRNVSDRWVVLKGLLDTGDADAMAAAVAERRFLAEVEHPNIVKIYNFVQHPDPKTGVVTGYTVMEFVGGKSLKEIAVERRQGADRQPLPLPQVIAYMLEVLPALGYLHQIGLLYCDFKPDNVIQTDEQVRLIDMGAVRRMDDDESPVYGTVGYQAPEIATEGPSISSDLYTVARTMAVLSIDFRGYTSTFKDTLPGPDEVPLFAQADSYYRLLRRATHQDPARRFGAAQAMAEQLTGVLREVMAEADGQPRPGLSTLFSPEQRVFGIPAVGRPAAGPGAAQAFQPPEPREVAAALPVPLVDIADAAAGILATTSSTDPAELIEALAKAPLSTVEIRLRIARARIQLGDLAGADTDLDELEADQPGDWRVTWYRGLAALAAGQVDTALATFGAVYDWLPGEAAPKLALAACAELRGDLPTAARRYAQVWRTDPSYISAGFGLARVTHAQGDPTAAVGILDAIPTDSVHHVAAQVAAIRAIAGAGPIARLTSRSLVDASTRMRRLRLDAELRARLTVELLDIALAWVLAPGRPTGSTPDAKAAGELVLDCRLTEEELRFGLERSFRALARLSTDRGDRIALVDRANSIRPRTLL